MMSLFVYIINNFFIYLIILFIHIQCFLLLLYFLFIYSNIYLFNLSYRFINSFIILNFFYDIYIIYLFLCDENIMRNMLRVSQDKNILINVIVK